MCQHRLAVGEAPACVQACPNQAIRIAIVDKQEIAENAEANFFLPGAPEPGYTLPTTVYKTRRALPGNLLPANYYSATPQHAHWPLVLMLVLTQMSVGAFVVEQFLLQFLHGLKASSHGSLLAVRPAAAFGLGLVGIGASIFHLGRPWLAYRAVIAWRTSWLSREVLAFGGFAALASAYAGVPWFASVGIPIPTGVTRWIGWLVAFAGIVGVACSTMIYASTRRVFWNPAYTGLKFLLTCLILGLPVALVIQLVDSMWLNVPFLRQIAVGIAFLLIVSSSIKLVAESAVFCWLGSRRFTAMRRTALLMTGDLRRVSLWRYLLGILGGVLMPCWIIGTYPSTVETFSSPQTVIVAALTLAVCFVGELLERYMFFAAVVAPKMPGAPAT
jgi:DMSO reductase anchor subunit